MRSLARAVKRASRLTLVLIVLSVVGGSIAVVLLVHGRGTPPPRPGAPFVGNFETGDLSQWDHVADPDPRTNPPRTVKAPVRQGRYAAELTVDPSDTSEEPGATRVDLFEDASPKVAGERVEEWERVWVLFPSSAYTRTPFRPVPGNWNWLVQWHSSSRLIGPQERTGGQPFALGVQTGAALPRRRCSYSADVAGRLELAGYVTAGDVAGGPRPQRRFCTHRRLRLNHWYEVALHVIWSTDPREGVFQVWIDGRRLLDLHQATLIFNSDTGAVDLPNPELSNYRGPDPRTGRPPTWSSSVFYDGLRLGPTATSVGFEAPRGGG